jgi:hypothetical protein
MKKKSRLLYLKTNKNRSLRKFFDTGKDDDKKRKLDEPENSFKFKLQKISNIRDEPKKLSSAIPFSFKFPSDNKIPPISQPKQKTVILKTKEKKKEIEEKNPEDPLTIEARKQLMKQILPNTESIKEKKTFSEIFSQFIDVINLTIDESLFERFGNSPIYKPIDKDWVPFMSNFLKQKFFYEQLTFTISNFDIKQFYKTKNEILKNKLQKLNNRIDDFKKNDTNKSEIINKINYNLKKLFENLIKDNPNFKFDASYKDERFENLFYICFTDNLLIDSEQFLRNFQTNIEIMNIKFRNIFNKPFKIRPNTFINDNFEYYGDQILSDFVERYTKNFFIRYKIKTRLKTINPYIEDGHIYELCKYYEIILKFRLAKNEFIDIFFKDQFRSNELLENLDGLNALTNPLGFNRRRIFYKQTYWQADYFEAFLFILVLNDPDFDYYMYLLSTNIVQQFELFFQNTLNTLLLNLGSKKSYDFLTPPIKEMITDMEIKMKIEKRPEYDAGKKHLKNFFKNLKNENQRLQKLYKEMKKKA